MHQAIVLVVDADGVTDAEELALDGFNKYLKSNLTVGESSGFDGPYDCGRINSGYGVNSSDERTAYSATSDLGFAEIESAWNKTYDDFEYSIEKIQEMMEDATVEEMANNIVLRGMMGGRSALSPTVSHYLFDVEEYDVNNEYYGSDAPETDIDVSSIATPEIFEEFKDDLDGKWAVPIEVKY